MKIEFNPAELGPSQGRAYIKPADLAAKGTKAKILSEGWRADGTFKKQQLTLPIKVGDQEYAWTPNVVAQSVLVEEFGDDTKDWVGETITLKPRKIERGQYAGKTTIEVVV